MEEAVKVLPIFLNRVKMPKDHGVFQSHSVKLLIQYTKKDAHLLQKIKHVYYTPHVRTIKKMPHFVKFLNRNVLMANGKKVFLSNSLTHAKIILTTHTHLFHQMA